MDCIIPFGPLIYQNDISKEFHNFLLDNLDHSKEVGRDSRDTLAGHIDVERSATFDLNKFQSFVEIHIRRFVYLYHERELQCQSLHNPTTRSDQYKFNEFIVGNIMDDNIPLGLDFRGGPWINYQRCGEFNPTHDHSGVISSVIFVDIPEEIDHENDVQKYQCMSHGCLEFVYDNSKTVRVTPKTGMILVFPADLRHQVYPFQSDVERVTLSFNIETPKINEKL